MRAAVGILAAAILLGASSPAVSQLATTSLPDLSDRVFIRPGSLVCDSAGLVLSTTSMNPEGWVQLGRCVLSREAVEVLVFAETGDYDTRGTAVLIGRRSSNRSDARILSGWVKVDRLSNEKEAP